MNFSKSFGEVLTIVRKSLLLISKRVEKPLLRMEVSLAKLEKKLKAPINSPAFVKGL